jgi:hypothetical protein
MGEATTAQLVAAYNYFQRANNGTEIKKFSDRATAEKRVRLVMNLLKAEDRPQPFGPMDPGSTPDDGEQPNVGATNDAETPPQPPTKAAAAPAATAGDLQFGARAGSKLAGVIGVLNARRGEFVPIDAIVKAVYASDDTAKFKGPLGMVLKGVQKHIADGNLPVKLVKQKEGKVTAYGFIDA